MISPVLPNHSGLEIVHGDFSMMNDEPDGVFYDLFVGNGHELVNQARGVYLGLVCNFPTAQVVRIHGFDNEKLNALGQNVRRSILGFPI